MTPYGGMEGVARAVEIRTLHDVAAAVRGRRRDLKLTQASLAARAGVSRTFVSDLEGGKLTVEFRSVVAVLEALGYALSLHSPERGESPAAAAAGFDLDAFLEDYDGGLG